MCSVIEPETSIRQNITACATGSRHRLEPAVADVDRVDVGDQPGPRRSWRSSSACAAPADALGSAPASPSSAAISLRSSAISSGFGRRSAMRRDRLFRMVRDQRQVRRRAGDRIAGAMPAPSPSASTMLALGQVRQFEVFEEQVEELLPRQGEAELVLALAVRAALGAAAAGPASEGGDRVALHDTPCCRAAHVADAAARACVEASARGRRAPGCETSPPSSASRDAARAPERLVHGLAHQRFGPAQEALAVGEALAAWVEAAINDVHAAWPHQIRLCQPACFTRMYHSTSRRTCRSRVAARGHALDELAVLLLGLAVLLRSEADHRQQVLDLAEHAPLDHLADLLVAGPGRVPAVVGSPESAAQNFTTSLRKSLGLAMPGRLLDLGQLLVQQLAVQQLAGVGILEVHDPRSRHRHRRRSGRRGSGRSRDRIRDRPSGSRCR